MFIAALFIISKNRNNLKISLLGMDRHIVVNLYYGIKKKRERKKIKLLIHQTIWMNPKCIMLNERNHSKGCILYGSIYKHSRMLDIRL